MQHSELATWLSAVVTVQPVVESAVVAGQSSSRVYSNCSFPTYLETEIDYLEPSEVETGWPVVAEKPRLALYGASSTVHE